MKEKRNIYLLVFVLTCLLLGGNNICQSDELAALQSDLSSSYQQYLEAVNTNDQARINQAYDQYIRLLNDYTRKAQIRPPYIPGQAGEVQPTSASAASISTPDQNSGFTGIIAPETQIKNRVLQQFESAKKSLKHGDIFDAKAILIELYNTNPLPGARATAAYFLGIIAALENELDQAAKFFSEADAGFMNGAFNDSELLSLINDEPGLADLADLFREAAALEQQADSFRNSDRGFFRILGAFNPRYISARSNLTKSLERFTERRDQVLEGLEKQFYSTYQKGKIADREGHEKFRRLLDVGFKVSLNTTAKVHRAIQKEHDSTPFFHFVDRKILSNRAATLTNDFMLHSEDLERLHEIFEDTSDVFDLAIPLEGSDHGTARLLIPNPDSWHARWKIMDEAQRSIDVVYFIAENDLFGLALLAKLHHKASQGVRVRILFDARGTKSFSRTFLGQDFLQELAELPNADVKIFNPYFKALPSIFSNIRQAVSSNHDKIMVVDSKIAVTGGRNISKNYFLAPADDSDVYRDTDVLISSPSSVRHVTQAFEEEFYDGRNFEVSPNLFGNIRSRQETLNAVRLSMDHFMNTGNLLTSHPEVDDSKLAKFNEQIRGYNSIKGYDRFKLETGAHPARIRIIDKHSFIGTRNDMTQNIIRLMDNSRSIIHIQNPYVVLTTRAERALRRASLKGVPIILHTNSPMSTDSVLTQAMFLNDWKRLLAEHSTLQIHVNTGKNKLHAKVFAFDDVVSVIGTYNLDYLSEQVNSEVAAVVNSTSFTSENIQVLNDDMKDASQYLIEVTDDGEIKVIFGPESHSDPKILNKIKLLQKMTFLRPLI